MPSRTTTRRSTRKIVVGDEGEKEVSIETPAFAATTGKRAQVSMVRRKVETQFEEEEIENEKKSFPPILLHWGLLTGERYVYIEREIPMENYKYSMYTI